MGSRHKTTSDPNGRQFIHKSWSTLLCRVTQCVHVHGCERARSAGNIIVMERPEWADGLQAKGVYFEGMVSNVDQRVERHCNFLWYQDVKEGTSSEHTSTNTTTQRNCKLNIIIIATTLHHFLSISLDEQQSITSHILLLWKN